MVDTTTTTAITTATSILCEDLHALCEDLCLIFNFWPAAQSASSLTNATFFVVVIYCKHIPVSIVYLSTLFPYGNTREKL